MFSLPSGRAVGDSKGDEVGAVVQTDQSDNDFPCCCFLLADKEHLLGLASCQVLCKVWHQCHHLESSNNSGFQEVSLQQSLMVSQRNGEPTQSLCFSVSLWKTFLNKG